MRILFLCLAVMTVPACDSEPQRPPPHCLPVLCDIPQPGPIELVPAAQPLSLAQTSQRELGIALEVGSRIYNSKPSDEQPLGADDPENIPFRPFHFVFNPEDPSTADLWVQKHQWGETSFEAQQLMTGIDLASVRFRSNGPDISVIDAWTHQGPIFAPDYDTQTYVRLEYGSAEMAKRYSSYHFSSCFGGTLVATPKAWIEKRKRSCRP